MGIEVFRIKERKFKVYEAKVSATILDPYWYETYGTKYDFKYFWSLTISAEGKVFDSYNWEPNVSHENLVLPLRNWHDLEGICYEWEKPEGCFTVFGHEDVYKSSLNIGKRRGSRFEIAWNGLCDIHWNKEYSESVPFEIECEAEFIGVNVNGSEKDNDETMLSRLQQYMEAKNLKQVPIEYKKHKYQSGIGIASSKFLPIAGKKC